MIQDSDYDHAAREGTLLWAAVPSLHMPPREDAGEEEPMDVSLVYDSDEMSTDAANVIGAIGHEGDLYASSTSDDEDEGEYEDEMDEEDKDMKIEKLQHRLNIALQKVRRRKKTIERLQKTTEKEVRNFLKTRLPGSWINWIMGKKKRPVRQWGHDEIVQCLILRKKIGTKNYEYMRKQQMMPLPSSTTLRRRIKHFHVDLGLIHSSVEILRRHLEGEESEMRRLCCMSYDEFAVDPDISYDSREDHVIKSSSKMQCVLVRGLVRNFRVVVYANTDTAMSKELLTTIILACEQAGARIVACVSDMAPGKTL